MLQFVYPIEDPGSWSQGDFYTPELLVLSGLYILISFFSWMLGFAHMVEADFYLFIFCFDHILYFWHDFCPSIYLIYINNLLFLGVWYPHSPTIPSVPMSTWHGCECRILVRYSYVALILIYFLFFISTSLADYCVKMKKENLRIFGRRKKRYG